MKIWQSLFLTVSLFTISAFADSATEATASLKKAADYLMQNQNDDGSWCRKPQPAVAALCALALHQAPASDPAARDQAVDAAMRYVISNIDATDGAVRGKAPRILFFKFSPWPVYTTSISLVAMAEINKPEYLPLMKAAREYLKSMQAKDPSKIGAGGFGYDQNKRPDLSNTNWTAEALHVTRHLDEEPFGTVTSRKATKEMWQQMDDFLKSMQVPLDGEGEDVGGFGYKPQKDQAKIVATGTMTYAGLKSMIYAKVSPNDPRVQGALKWVGKHYTFEEVPGAKKRGHFYYLQTMTKALGAAGINGLELADGTKANWRADAIKSIVGMQNEDGSWNNPDGKYLESLPELVTAYAMISLKNAK